MGPPFRGSPFYNSARRLSGDSSVSDSATISSLPADEVLRGSGFSGRGHGSHSYDDQRRSSLQLYDIKDTSALSEPSTGAPSEGAATVPLALEVFQICTKLQKSPEKTEKKKGRKKRQQNLQPVTLEDRISISGNYISPPVEALKFARRTGKFRTTSSSELVNGSGAGQKHHTSSQSKSASGQ